jgi:hypothetical protein
MPDLIEQKRIYRHRLRAQFLGGFVLAVSCVLVVASLSGFVLSSDRAAHAAAPAAGTTFLSAIGPAIDTVYTTMPSWLEVHLARQMLYIHHRELPLDSMPISTGTSALSRGIETRKGIFLVQNKISMLYSLQFDSAKVYNWLGFNFGIGIHSLAGRGYYRHLGRRPSSHGCIRMSDSAASVLWRSVRLGTPVFVHAGHYARTVAFTPDTTTTPLTMPPTLALSLHERRLHALYRGQRLFHSSPVLPLSREYVRHEGIPIGDVARLPRRQRIPSASADGVLAARMRVPAPAPMTQQPLSNGEVRMEETILP